MCLHVCAWLSFGHLQHLAIAMRCKCQENTPGTRVPSCPVQRLLGMGEGEVPLTLAPTEAKPRQIDLSIGDSAPACWHWGLGGIALSAPA